MGSGVSTSTKEGSIDLTKGADWNDVALFLEGSQPFS
jgi:hypothetical protein